MKKVFLKLIIFTLSIKLIITGCSLPLTQITGSDNIVEKVYPFSDYNSLAISSQFHVEIIQSDEYKVIVKYNDNFEEYLKINQNDIIVEIAMLGKNFYNNAKLSAKIYMPELSSLKGSGACNVNIPDFNLTKLDLFLSGASNFNGNIVVSNDLKIKCSGASNITIQGSAKNAELELSGASNIEGNEIIIDDQLSFSCSGASNISNTIFSASNIDMDLSGGSVFICRINADNDLNLSSSGASEIKIEGTARNSKINSSGASSIKGKNMIICNMLHLDCSGASNTSLSADGDIYIKLSGGSVFNKYGNGAIVENKVSSGASVNIK